MNMKRSIAVILLALACTALHAQFSIEGSDPARLRWRSVTTDNFKIIYPVGSDSLARVYAYELERARNPLGWSSGLKTGSSYKTRMPVILHSLNPVANASVTWAPRRMDIYTAMDAYSPTPIPWARLLAIHEGRHSSQMQFGAAGKNKIFKFLTGDMVAGAFAGLYPGPVFLEGDAVVAETALTQSGRGRQASFLNYFMPAFDSGDWRNFWRWAYGSYTRYTPDHYRAGYMLIAGTRVFFDDPSFTDEYFSRVIRKGWFFNLQKTVKAASGQKFNKSFRTIEEGFRNIWAEEAAMRAPFMPYRQVTVAGKTHNSYSAGEYSSEAGIFTVKTGLYTPLSLVRVAPGGSEWSVRPFASYTGSLHLDKANGRIWWTETVMDKRWELAGESRVNYIETVNPAKVHTLAKGRRYFNPAPSPDGKTVAVTEYPSSGGLRICLLDSGSGAELATVDAPDSLQVTETSWIGDRLFAAGLSEHGMGIYEVVCNQDGVKGMTVLLKPQPVELSCLKTFGKELAFVCDRTGVGELYLFDPDSLKLLQATSTRYGISSPFLNPQADTLYYSSVAASDKPETYKQGRMIYATAVSDLPVKEVSFQEIHKYPVAETLTMQEKELAGAEWEGFEDFGPVAVSEPKAYSKIRLPYIHSWAPIYFDYDKVDDISLDEYYRTASLGATALFQNLLGTGYGFVGYNAHEDPYNEGKWRHSGHLHYIYTGLYPVFDMTLDFNDRSALDTQRQQAVNEEEHTVRLYSKGTQRKVPYVSGKVSAYVPLTFSSGGISRGIVPQVSFRFSNDRLNDQISLRKVVEEEDGKASTVEISTIGKTNLVKRRTLDINVRGYAIRTKAPSQVYPSFGIGAELGLRTHPGKSRFYSPSMYVYAYGYAPGLRYDQGFRFSFSGQTSLNHKEYSYTDGYISMVPRGFVESSLGGILTRASSHSFKVTVDYAVPFLSVDWSFLCPAFYIKNFQLTPFADISVQDFNYSRDFIINPGNVASETLLSCGADLVVNLGNFLWLPFDSRFGIRYARNWWSTIDSFPIGKLERNYLGTVFSVDF